MARKRVADILGKSYSEAIKEITHYYGKEPSRWQWGTMHTATFRSQKLGKSGVGPIEALFNRGPFSTGGGEAIVNATGWSIVDGYEVNWLPSMRMIVDLGDLNQSLTVHTTGQSGHAFNDHYSDMSTLWASNRNYPMWWEQDAIIQKAEGHLILVPE